LNKFALGANPFISESRMKQSNEKNASFGEFTLFDAENTLVKLNGILMLNDNEADINWM
jgi:hypothetical protein